MEKMQPPKSLVRNSAKPMIGTIPPVNKSAPRPPPLPTSFTMPIKRLGQAPVPVPVKESIRAINNGIRALDLLYAIICRQFQEFDFVGWGNYVWNDVPRIIIREFNRLKDFLLKGYKPRVLRGRHAIVETDLLQYKQRSFDYDTDTDDAISLGDSTICMSVDKLKTSELEAELAKIKESMNSVFESKISEMQATIMKQAEAQADLEAKMQVMMEQMQTQTANPHVSMPVQKPTTGSIPSVNKSAPIPPPLPSKSKLSSDMNEVPKFGQDRTNLMESIRAAGGFDSSGLKPSKNQSSGFKSSSENEKSAKKPLGYDYRNELAEQLLKRRAAIEKTENYDFVDAPDHAKKTYVNPIVSSMLERMPAPSSPSSSNFGSSRNSTFNDDDWN